MLSGITSLFLSIRPPKTVCIAIYLTLFIIVNLRCIEGTKIDETKYRYQKKFNDQCIDYNFVRQYDEIAKSHDIDRYVIFVFHETGSSNGGLGDRFAGLISATAYAIRFKRKLIIAGDKSFQEYFQPLYGNNTYLNWHSHVSVSDGMQTLPCINPKPGKERLCAMYTDYPNKVVKIYTNRCYLCRWSILPKLGLQSHLNKLGIHSASDLFQVAGCLMRLSMNPTESLWNDLARFLATQGSHINYPSVTFQIGIHFRCGDSSFDANNAKVNPQCVFTSADSWKGTMFFDDKTLDSPIDQALCVRKILENMTANDPSRRNLEDNVMVYLASDNILSAKQINDTLRWPTTLIPDGACHVDMGASKCVSMTLLHWFALSLSDIIVTQALLIDNPQSIYIDNDLGTPDNPFALGPISAFSRYAGIYGLSSHSMVYGRGCLRSNSSRLSRQTSGNWVCNPRKFF